MNSALYFVFSDSLRWVKRGKIQLGSSKERLKRCLFAQAVSLSYLKVGLFSLEMLRQIRQGIQEPRKKRKHITIILKAVDLVWSAYTKPACTRFCFIFSLQ